MQKIIQQNTNCNHVISSCLVEFLTTVIENHLKVLTVLDWFFQHPDLFPEDYRLSTLLWAREKAVEITEYQVWTHSWIWLEIFIRFIGLNKYKITETGLLDVEIRDNSFFQPSNAYAWYLLGVAEYQSKNKEGAEEAFRKSIALNPGNLSIRHRIERIWALPEDELKKNKRTKRGKRVDSGYYQDILRRMKKYGLNDNALRGMAEEENPQVSRLWFQKIKSNPSWNIWWLLIREK